MSKSRGERRHLQELQRRKTQSELSRSGGGTFQHTATITSQQYSGPLPHPDVLQRYDEILPGSAERILSGWETESAFRREIEAQDLRLKDFAVRKQIGFQGRGQWMGLAIGLSGVGVTALGIVFDQPWVAAILGGGSMVTMVTAFLGTWRKKKSDPQPAVPQRSSSIGRQGG